MKISVFCSANNTIDQSFFQATEELGRWMAENNHELVFGGVNQGLMECIAKAVKAAGGHTIGVVPSIVEETGRTSAYNDEVVTCNNLSERKQLMLDMSDIFIALPGGIGTLDEIFTIAASYTIGYHRKRVILYNINGFWNTTITLLDDMQQRGMIRGNWRDYIGVASSIAELEELF